MSRFGGFLGGSGLPDPSDFNSSAPGVYSLEEVGALRRLGYWPLIEQRDPYYSVTQFILSTSGTIKDVSANASTLTTVGYTRIKIDGPSGRPVFAAYNSAGSAYIRPADNGNFTIGTGDYTLECWVWPTGQGNNDQPLFDTRNTSNGSGGTFFGFRNSDGAIRADGNYSFGTGSVQMRQWNHVAFIRENGQLSVYVNGAKQGNSVVSTINHTSSTLVIGGYSYSPLGTSPLIGYIFDARVTIGTSRYTGSSFTAPVDPAPAVQELIPPFAPTLNDSFYGDQSVALNWRNAFNGGSDFTSFDIEYSTASDMSGGTVVNIPAQSGSGPFGFSSATSFSKSNYGSEVDVLIPGVLEITRGSANAIYNSAVESGWNGSTPQDTEWALGWGSECDVATKTFTALTGVWGNQLGNNIVNAELVMRHVPTGRIWFIKFSAWTQGGSGGGFAYERREFYGCPTIATAHTVTGLTNDTPYYFRVRANNAIGNGVYSSIAGPITPSSNLPIALVGAAAPTTYYGFNTRQDNYWYSTSLANKIFDNSLTNNNENQWKSTVTTASFAVDFGQQEELLRYRMWRNTGNEGTPTRWYLQGSNTESDYTSISNTTGVLPLNTGNWTTIDTRENINLPKVSTAVPADEPYGEFNVANPGNYRYYRLYVNSVRADGPGTTTNRIFLAEMQLLALAPAAPITPTNLEAFTADGGAIVNWDAVGLVDDFIVEWSEDQTFATTLGTTTSPGRSATITGLVNGTTYYVRVKSNYSGIHSAYTSAVSFVPAAGYTPIEDNILRFHLSEATTGINVNVNTTSGYAKLEATDGTTTTTSSVASTNAPSYAGHFYSYGPITLTGLATGVEKIVKVISCDAAGNPSGELVIVDFNNSANSGRTITLIDASGCLELDSILAGATGTNYKPQGYLNPGLTVVRALNAPFAYGYYNYHAPSFINVRGALNLSGQLLSGPALNQLYDDLPTGLNNYGKIVVGGNPGISSDDPSIATGKGYTVYGS